MQKRTGAKSRNEELSDSADEEYETDGEDDVRHNRLQKAKRLDDSDDNSDDNNEVSCASVRNLWQFLVVLSPVSLQMLSFEASVYGIS